VNDLLGLDGKTAIVTGATGGIGREVARGLATAGVRVALVDVDADACRGVADEIPGDNHLAIGCDLRDVGGFAELVASIRESLGTIDILACLAAVLRRRATIDDVTLEDWDIQLDVNLKSVFFLNREVANVFRAQGGGGRIINFSSQGWWTGGFGG
jgi:3-oxoacyl-[acyl-carrier protein] reductase